MEHFIFLLEKLGFEVKQGKHIAVKVPGMKRFKRLDTISEDLCRESLEAMFRYGDASLAAPVNRAVSLLPARKAVFHRTRESAMQGGIVCISLRKNGSLINLACERRRVSEIGIADSCNDLGAMALAVAPELV